MASTPATLHQCTLVHTAGDFSQLEYTVPGGIAHLNLSWSHVKVRTGRGGEHGSCSPPPPCNGGAGELILGEAPGVYNASGCGGGDGVLSITRLMAKSRLTQKSAISPPTISSNTRCRYVKLFIWLRYTRELERRPGVMSCLARHVQLSCRSRTHWQSSGFQPNEVADTVKLPLRAHRCPGQRQKGKRADV